MINKGDIRKILVVTLSNLGDVILTLPVFESLSRAFPSASIDAVVGSGAAEALELSGKIRRVILYQKRSSWDSKWKYLSDIRGERYDLIIDLRHSLVGLLGGARFRNRYPIFPKKKTHSSLRHLRALGGIAPPVLTARSFLPIDQAAFAVIDKRISEFFGNKEWLTERSSTSGRRLVVAAVGSKSDLKKWPARYYASLLDRLSILERCHIVLVGDRNDALDCQNVKSLMRSEALDLSGQTNLRELAALLKNASLVITNDSFPLHLADALGAPVLALFGPTDPRKYGPRLVSASRVARRVLFCSPCEKAQCRYGHECMNELGVDETYHDAVRILREDAHPKKLRILVSRLDRLGDVALSLPATAAIRERYPEAFIAMMVRPSIRELVEPCPWIDEVIGYDYGRGGRHQGFIGAIRFIREIRKRRFDAAFILHPSNRAHIVPFLSDIPYRVGLDSNLAFLLTKRVPDRRREGSKHESEYCLDVIRSFGIDGKSGHDLRIPLVPEAQRSVAATLQEQGLRDSDKLVAIHPGASCPSKRWPRERFAELARRILSETSYRIVVVGGTEEKHLGRYLWDQAGGEVIDLSGRLSVKQLAALLARCQVLVSNDSGPVHVAAAVGTPTLALFGRNEPGLARRRWKAMGGGHQTIHKDVGCVVCLAHACTIDFECLKAIDVEEVFNDLTKMLERGGLKQNEKILLPN